MQAELFHARTKQHIKEHCTGPVSSLTMMEEVKRSVNTEAMSWNMHTLSEPGLQLGSPCTLRRLLHSQSQQSHNGGGGEEEREDGSNELEHADAGCAAEQSSGRCLVHVPQVPCQEADAHHAKGPAVNRKVCCRMTHLGHMAECKHNRRQACPVLSEFCTC